MLNIIESINHDIHVRNFKGTNVMYSTKRNNKEIIEVNTCRVVFKRSC